MRLDGGKKEEEKHRYINIMAKSSTLHLGNVHRHGTTLAGLFSKVLFIIFGDGQVLVGEKKTLGLKLRSQSIIG